MGKSKYKKYDKSLFIFLTNASVLKDVQNSLNDMEHVDTDLKSVLAESE